MKAMILAAGRGKRMGNLTLNTPKPLIEMAGKPLIVHQIERLRAHGFDTIVINVGYLGEQICTYLGDGSRYGVSIQYSVEPQEGLETGGGVFQALSLLGDEPFVLTNADVYCDYPYSSLRTVHPHSVHLVLVDNPDFKPTGDFSICTSDNDVADGNDLSGANAVSNAYGVLDGVVSAGRLQLGHDYTFSGVSVINPRIFSHSAPGFFPIAPLFRQSVADKTATAEYYRGIWCDVGTPERLLLAEKNVSHAKSLIP